MKTIKKLIYSSYNYFGNKRLIQKFFMLYVIVIVIPIVMLSTYTFNQLEVSAKLQLLQSLNYSSEILISNVNSNIELIDRLSIVNDNFNFKQYIAENEHAEIDDLVFFYNYYINNIEKIRNSNPNIYGIRIFLENKEFLEQWPIVYNEERLSSIDWTKKIYESDKKDVWFIDYDEIIIPNYHYNAISPKKLVTLVKDMKYGSLHLGFIETSIEMSSFFKGMYDNAESNIFISVLDLNESNAFYYDKNNNFYLENSNIESLFSTFNERAVGDEGFFELKFNSHDIYVSYRYIKPLKLYVFNFVSSEYSLAHLREKKSFFIFTALIIIIVLFLITFRIISMLLKNLNKIIISMREIKDGNLEAKKVVESKDEIGELDEHFQGMLTRIKILVKDVLREQEMVKNAEIKALQTQINAHFMNNTLESIRMMAECNNQLQISDSIANLGKLLSYSMNWKNASVNLLDEIKYTQSYIDLLNIRRDHFITLSIKIEEGLEYYKILKMSLQPIIENAVKHGIDPSQYDSVIRMNVYTKDEYIVIEISDSGIGIDEENVIRINNMLTGSINDSEEGCIGLKNIAQRIQVSHGNEYGISVISKQYAFTKVSITLPKQLERKS
jgi:two-component system, sensor histidine kinase YesM